MSNDASPGRKVESDPATPPPGLCRQTATQQCFRVGTGQWVSVTERPGKHGFLLLDMGGPGFAAADTGAVESRLPACVDFVSDIAQPPLENVVTEVSGRLGQHLTGIVTFSFGATRTREIWPLLGTKGTLLVVQPSPTPALSMDRISALRAEAAWSTLDGVRAKVCAESACTSVEQVRTRLRSSKVDQQWSKTGTEMSLFVIGAIADTVKYQALLAKLFAGATYSEAVLSQVHRVAMSVTHTLGPDAALTSNAGYRAAMCQAYGAPGSTGSTDPLELAYQAQVGPCGESTSTYSTSPPSAPPRSCLVTSPDDPVIPKSLLNTAGAFGKGQSVTYGSAVHAWPESDIARLRISTTCSLGGS